MQPKKHTSFCVLKLPCAVVVCALLYCTNCQSTTCDDGDVRLVGGPNEFEGRVEVCFGGVWGQVCGRQWDRDDGSVVCRQLNYGQGNPFVKIDDRAYGRSDGPALVDVVRCNGSEGRLDECNNSRINRTDCGSSLNAIVVCKDPVCLNNPQNVRLIDGNSTTEGRIEICDDGFRRGVCSSSLGEEGARAVCRELGLLPEGEGVLVDSNEITYLKYLNLNCSGSENTSLSTSCDLTQGEDRCPVASVVCPGTSGRFPGTTTPDTTSPGESSTTLTHSTTQELTTAGPGPQPTNNMTNTTPPVTAPDSTASSTEPSTTVGVPDDSTPPLSTTVAVILGVAGGVIVTLVVAIVIILLVLVFTLRKQKKQQYFMQHTERGNGHANGLNSHDKDEKTVLNSLYTTTASPPVPTTAYNADPRPQSSSTLTEDIQPYECAELEEIRSRARTGTFTSRKEYSPPFINNMGQPSKSVPEILRELTPVLPPKTSSLSTHVYTMPIKQGGAITDVEGYASLENPLIIGDSKQGKVTASAITDRYILQHPMSPAEYQTPVVYDSLFETPTQGNIKTNQEYDLPEVHSDEHRAVEGAASPPGAREYDVPEGSNVVSHEYDLPPSENPVPLDNASESTGGDTLSGDDHLQQPASPGYQAPAMIKGKLVVGPPAQPQGSVSQEYDTPEGHEYKDIELVEISSPNREYDVPEGHDSGASCPPANPHDYAVLEQPSH